MGCILHLFELNVAEKDIIWATHLRDKAYVYVITNLLGGKLYVGKTTNPVTRWTNHKISARKGKMTPLHTAMRDHGVGNFTYTVVMARPSEEEAYDWEGYWEQILDSRTTGHGYNKKKTGHGITSVSSRAARNPRNLGYSPTKKFDILMQVSELSREGLSVIQIAEQIGKSWQRVYVLLEEAGLHPSSPRDDAKTEAMSLAVDLHAQGLSLREIGSKIQRGHKNVRRLLKEAGVRQPCPHHPKIHAQRKPVILALREQGMTCAEIVKETGFSKAAVWRTLKSENLTK